MATALTGLGVIRLNYAIAAGGLDNYHGYSVAAGMSLRVYADDGAVVFNGFVTELDNTTGDMTVKPISCDSAAVSWTDLYTAPAGKSAFFVLAVSNLGATAGAYSFGIAGITVVEGEGSPG